MKKLRSWQGHLHDRECGVCDVRLRRDDSRWRCEEHCQYDVCGSCYDKHVASVRQKKAKAADDFNKLHSAPEAQQRREAAELPDGLKPGLLFSLQGVDKRRLLEVLFWVTVCLVSSPLVESGISTLVNDSDLNFPPSGWLAVGLSSIVAAALVKLADLVHGRIWEASVQVPWKFSAMVGCVQGLCWGFAASECVGAAGLGELGIGGAFTSELRVVTPALLFAGGVIAGLERRPERQQLELAVAVGSVTVGCMLTGQLALGWNAVFHLPLVLFVAALTAAQWVFTQLCNEQLRPSAISLAAGALPTAAALCFELTFMTYTSAYKGLFELHQPGRVSLIILANGVGIAFLFVAEVRLVQLVSVTLLGFIGPLTNVVLVFSALVLSGKNPPSFQWVGVLVCVLSVGIYAYARLVGARVPAEDGGYSRLEAGAHPHALAAPYGQPVTTAQRLGQQYLAPPQYGNGPSRFAPPPRHAPGRTPSPLPGGLTAGFPR